MGSSPSKPTKPTRKPQLSKSAISRPTPQHSTTLTYPSLSPLPFRPLPHHPTASPYRPSAEQELYARVAHFAQKPEKAYHRPGPTPAPAAQQSRPKKPVAAKPVAAKPLPKSQHPLKPLNEIGAPKASKPKPNPKPASAKKKAAYGLYPSAQKGDSKGSGAVGVNLNLRPGARYGGMKQDRHGEWWVLVLADGRWWRAGEVGVRGIGGK